MSAPARFACLQVNPGADLCTNVAAALALAREAVAGGARVLLLPEYAFLLHASGRVMRERSPREDAHPAVAAFAEFAREHRAWILLGSLTVATGEDRIANRSLLLDERGHVAARYDKIHMFDATLPDGRVIRESATYRPGDRAVVVDTPFGRLGLSICYDVRFPQLYRAMAQAGAEILVVPSAFTAATGALHWHALLRARAIENGCYVLAPATCGMHPGDHATFGHTLVVDPAGAIVADGGDAPGCVLADVDLGRVAATRSRIAALAHDRPFTLDAPTGATPCPPERLP